MPGRDGPPPRLSSAMLVSALIRRVNAEGGFGTVIHRGDDQAGAILVECADRGAPDLLLERATALDGSDGWRTLSMPGDADAAGQADRIARRRQSDPDLWVIELDIADAQRFAAETIGAA